MLTSMMKIKILVATHKPYWMPSDEVYLPIQVGSTGKEELGFQRDDDGDNISLKNPDYCELTGLYWAWKNLDADYVGSVHYRRHFVSVNRGIFSIGKRENILTGADWKKILLNHPIIVPNKRKYYIESIKSQYVHAHDSYAFSVMEKILQEKYPLYISAFSNLSNRRWAHMFNMFVMRKDYFDAYCTWLFDVLFELEIRLPSHEPRLFGFLSERLLDVWLEANELSYREVPIAFMEKQNWVKKGIYFVKRKLRGIS